MSRGNKEHTLKNNRILKSMHYTHSWVNHSLNFVDPITGTHRNAFEGLWETRTKRHIKRMRECVDCPFEMACHDTHGAVELACPIMVICDDW
ncbi:hypothetical protein F443_21297 [Phytophthora nicotianae P1569]|uniref:Uncharacterized protein n=1 Tax=Phytophthora nicotianae P1569 TaxID=1317065 RepID=V9DZR0_PHYNI|nr:hypothetical protein F443_21297 [Phytophthora nicotianae P1569]